MISRAPPSPLCTRVACVASLVVQAYMKTQRGKDAAYVRSTTIEEMDDAEKKEKKEANQAHYKTIQRLDNKKEGLMLADEHDTAAIKQVSDSIDEATKAAQLTGQAITRKFDAHRAARVEHDKKVARLVAGAKACAASAKARAAPTVGAAKAKGSSDIAKADGSTKAPAPIAKASTVGAGGASTKASAPLVKAPAEGGVGVSEASAADVGSADREAARATKRAAQARHDAKQNDVFDDLMEEFIPHEVPLTHPKSQAFFAECARMDNLDDDHDDDDDDDDDDDCLKDSYTKRASVSAPSGSQKRDAPPESPLAVSPPEDTPPAKKLCEQKENEVTKKKAMTAMNGVTMAQLQARLTAAKAQIAAGITTPN